MNFKQLGVFVSVSTVLGMNVGMNVLGTKALAQEEPSIRFGKAIAAPGCVIADQLVGEDGRTLSLLFTNFESKNGKRKNCNIRVNATIPSGFIVQDVGVLYQGSADVPAGTKPATLSRSYSFTGSFGIFKIPSKTTEFASTDPLFQVEDEETFVGASCSGTGQLGVNMIAQSRQGNSIIVDTADFQSGEVKFVFEIAPCP